MSNLGRWRRCHAPQRGLRGASCARRRAVSLAAADDRRPRAPPEDGRGTAFAGRSFVADGGHRPPLPMQGVQNDSRRIAKRSDARLSILTRRDRVRASALVISATERGFDSDSGEHGEGFRRDVSNTLAIAPPLDQMRAGALRISPRTARHHPSNRVAHCDVRGGACAAIEWLRPSRRLLGRGVLSVTIDDTVLARPSPIAMSTSPGPWALSAQGESNSPAPHLIHGAKETKWIRSESRLRSSRPRTTPRQWLSSADFGHREHPFRRIVITRFAHRDQGEGTRGVSSSVVVHRLVSTTRAPFQIDFVRVVH